MPPLPVPRIATPDAEPPFWLPLILSLPLLGGLALLAVPLLGYGPASVSRTLFLTTLLAWLLPLTALQRALWRRELAPIPMVLALLAATLCMALVTRAAYLLLRYAVAGGTTAVVDASLFRGLEAPWLALAAYASLHAVLAYAWALRAERIRSQQAHSLARDAELRALRLQLQPHFLFNTLSAVSGLIAAGRGDEAQSMLARLADFLRATLEHGHAHEAMLADELALTEAYLEIEKARLGERLQLEWSIGPGVLAARVPRLLLQPLVENAVRHGIAPRRAPGRLDIRIAAEGTQLRVDVANDLPDASERSAEDPCRRSEGIGLRNLAGRLAMLYPNRHALRSGVGEDGRWRVELALPLHAQGAAA